MEGVDFGADLECGWDIDPMMVELHGDDPRIVTEACIRRLQCPRGALLDDPDYGLDVREFLRQPIDRVMQAAIPSMISSELLKDDRVKSVSVSVTSTGTAVDPRLELAITGTTDGPPFTLIAAITTDEVRMELVR